MVVISAIHDNQVATMIFYLRMVVMMMMMMMMMVTMITDTGMWCTATMSGKLLNAPYLTD